MPGMTEAHTHFSWNNSATLDGIQVMPPEEHTLWVAHVAKKYLEHGWTSCVGAAAAKPRLDIVIRNAINSGMLPGPRYLAASQEITVLGNLGDESLPHIQYPEYNFGAVVNGPEDMRKVVRTFLKYGVDSIKVNLSGDNILPGAGATTTWITDEEVAMAVKETKMRGKRVSVHARSCESIKMALRHGAEVIYHASYATKRRSTCSRRRSTGSSLRRGFRSSSSCSMKARLTASVPSGRANSATRTNWRPLPEA
jgi:imidazolonepropionase-like amidohydrolase